jgi:ferredoxin-type protein NapG
MCEDIPCMRACPTGALASGLEEIAHARMGLAVIDIENCLSWQGLRCEICHRECPLKDSAISIEHQSRKLSRHAMFVPLVHSEACTGCGICEQACPTDRAAIRVVQADLVQGAIGKHYRLGWKQDGGISERFETLPLSDQPAEATGLDYLNDGDL